MSNAPIDTLPDDILNDPMAALIAKRFSEDADEDATDATDNHVDATDDTTPAADGGDTNDADDTTGDGGGEGGHDADAADVIPPTPAADAHLAIPLPDGSTHDLDVQSAQGLLALASWAQANQQHAPAFAAIEQGQAIAVSRADYEAFQAWQSTRSTPSKATEDAYDTLAEVDPEAAAEFKRLRDENARLTAEHNAPAQQTAWQRQQLEAQMSNSEREFLTASASWAQENGVDEDTADRLLRKAVELKVVGGFVAAGQTINPANGQVLVPARMETVARQSLDFALATEPELFNQVATRRAGTSTADTSHVTDDARRDAIGAKKARAASLSSTPSASVALPAKDVTKMTDSEHTAAISAAIAQAAGLSK